MFSSLTKWPRARDDSFQSSSALPPPDLALPSLGYNLWDHRKKLIIVTSLLVSESSILPITLFYGLWFGTNLDHGALFAIITSFFGFITGLEFCSRSLKLVRPSDTYRPLGGRRWHFDFSHLTLSIAYTVMTGILIGASIPHEPIVPALALPVPYVLVQVGLQMIVTGVLSNRRSAAPFRISSVPRGGRVPPLLYTFIEDIVAVDGNGTRTYRMALQERYDASVRFRTMIAQLNWFWGVSGFAVGAALIIIVWNIPGEVAYGVGMWIAVFFVLLRNPALSWLRLDFLALLTSLSLCLGWGVPLVFVTLWTVATIWWTRRSLKVEREMWCRPPDGRTEAAIMPMEEQRNTCVPETLQ